jgi:mono/diheme cytochrome c family protein
MGVCGEVLPVKAPPSNPVQAEPLHGLVVEFDSPGALVTAAERVRDAGYTRWDTYSPFPVHGIDQAMGIRPTRLPWIVFVLGVCGFFGGLLLQWWTNATDARQFGFVPTHFQGYAFIISGKPAFSLPANIPVIFETTVLLSALAAVFGMLAMNNLPHHSHALFSLPRFRRVTADRFFLGVEAADPRFDLATTGELLAALGGAAVERVTEPPPSSHLPRAITLGLVIAACLAILPVLYVARARVAQSPQPRLHIVQDMDNQERYKAQQAHPLFADGRELRPQVEGTIARGDLPRSPAFATGQENGQFVTKFPAEVQVTLPLLQRGQQRFNIYCAPCHGLGGAGDGIVGQRALALETPGWTQPASLLDQTARDRPNGHIFNTITNGIRTMPPYGDQIPEADRWAIVAYVRALQRSQNARLDDLTPEERAELR